MSKTEDKVMAVGVITLVREHKSTCTDKKCYVCENMQILKSLYTRLVGREITNHENLTFA